MNILRRLRLIAFYALVGLLSAFLILIFWDIAPSLILGWLPDGILGSIHAQINDLLPHRLHIMVMNSMLWGLVLGVVLQFFQPRSRLAPFLQSLTFMLVFLVVEVSLGEGFLGTVPVLVPLILIGLLHPGLREMFKFGRPDWKLVVLVVIAVVPLVIFAASQARLALADIPGDEHNMLEHWKRMTVFPTLMIAWGLLGSTKLPGVRLTGWLVAMPMAVFGLQSLFFPQQASAVGWPWAIAAVSWAILYLVISERRFRDVVGEG